MECYACDGTGTYRFCPDPDPDNQCRGCESEVCHDCEGTGEVPDDLWVINLFKNEPEEEYEDVIYNGS